MTAEIKTNDDAETSNSVGSKVKNRRKQNLEDDANRMQSHKEDSQRSNLSIKYLIETLEFKYPDHSTCFYCVQSAYFKVRFDIAIRYPSKRS